jgi:ribosomal protein S21
MPTVTIDGNEIGVASRSIVRMADRLHRLGPVRRAAYIEKIRRRIAKRGASRNDTALIFAAGDSAFGSA